MDQRSLAISHSTNKWLDDSVSSFHARHLTECTFMQQTSRENRVGRRSFLSLQEWMLIFQGTWLFILVFKSASWSFLVKSSKINHCVNVRVINEQITNPRIHIVSWMKLTKSSKQNSRNITFPFHGCHLAKDARPNLWWYTHQQVQLSFLGATIY